MRLATRVRPNNEGADTVDPREQESAEIIDLASRAAYPLVAARKAKGDGLGLAAGAALVLGLGAITLWSLNSARIAPPDPGVDAGLAPPPAAAPVAAADPMAPEFAFEAAEPEPEAAPAPEAGLAQDPGLAPVPRPNPYASPSLIYDTTRASNEPRLLAPPAPAAEAGPAPAGEAAGGNDAAAFASRIGGVGGAPARATPMLNPSTTVTQGTLIPAILETAINTDVPGYVRAVVSQDVRSFDGRRVLVPRSSRLIGQYQSGVQNGQRRAYVIWTRLIRPDGVSVNVASPAIAFDGTTGLAGDVSNHFFKRFGSGLLLSVVGGLGMLAAGRGGVVIAGVGDAAAAAAIQQSGDISPTIRVRMGEPIRVFTARDLDFSTVGA